MINQYNDKNEDTHNHVEELEKTLIKCIDYNNVLHENGIKNPFLKLSEKLKKVIKSTITLFFFQKIQKLTNKIYYVKSTYLSRDYKIIFSFPKMDQFNAETYTFRSS
jgi:hypothetical protein